MSRLPSRRAAIACLGAALGTTRLHAGSVAGFGGSTDLFGNYAGRARDLKPWLAGAQINRDRNLRLQYLAGLGLNLYQADVIYSDMLRYVTRTPDDLFAGSDDTRRRLFAAIQVAQGRPQ